MRVCAVDCGTNSIRLLVADLVRDAAPQEVARRTEIVRLGQGVDRTGLIDQAALSRTLAMCREYADQAAALGVERVRFVATSAVRDAGNGEGLLHGAGAAFARYATEPEVLTGEQEARLGFAGAAARIRAAGLPGPYLVVDIGGGSTELVRGQGSAEAQYSMDVGSVRLTERHLAADPPTSKEIERAQSDVERALGNAGRQVDLRGIGTAVGVAASVLTVTAHALELTAYDRERIDLARLPVDRAIAACTSLLQMTRAQRGALPYLRPGRADVIGAGALIWRCILNRLRDNGTGQVIASVHDILDGLVASMATDGVADD